ncbi:hypothetical protein F4860DRAFT_483680 [Xylaria cubensis]|nr:hypothetical protein F4860DRAFT_483680 [Xylaria cubensis]
MNVLKRDDENYRQAPPHVLLYTYTKKYDWDLRTDALYYVSIAAFKPLFRPQASDYTSVVHYLPLQCGVKHRKSLARAVANGPVPNHMATEKETSLLQALGTELRRSSGNTPTLIIESQPSLSANHGGGAADETTGEDQHAMTDDTPRLNLPLRPSGEPKSPPYSQAVAGQLDGTVD